MGCAQSRGPRGGRGGADGGWLRGRLAEGRPGRGDPLRVQLPFTDGVQLRRWLCPGQPVLTAGAETLVS